MEKFTKEPLKKYALAEDGIAFEIPYSINRLGFKGCCHCWKLNLKSMSPKMVEILSYQKKSLVHFWASIY